LAADPWRKLRTTEFFFVRREASWLEGTHVFSPLPSWLRRRKLFLFFIFCLFRENLRGAWQNFRHLWGTDAPQLAVLVQFVEFLLPLLFAGAATRCVTLSYLRVEDQTADRAYRETVQARVSSQRYWHAPMF